MDCFSSVVWSLGYTGLAEAATFSIVSFTCRQKGWHYHALWARLSHGTPLPDMAVGAHGLDNRELEQVVCSQDTFHMPWGNTET